MRIVDGVAYLLCHEPHNAVGVKLVVHAVGKRAHRVLRVAFHDAVNQAVENILLAVKMTVQ